MSSEERRPRGDLKRKRKKRRRQRDEREGRFHSPIASLGGSSPARPTGLPAAAEAARKQQGAPGVDEDSTARSPPGHPAPPRPRQQDTQLQQQVQGQQGHEQQEQQQQQQAVQERSAAVRVELTLLPNGATGSVEKRRGRGKKQKRKTLSARSKRAAVLGAVAVVEVARAAAVGAADAAAAPAGAAAPPAVGAAPAPAADLPAPAADAAPAPAADAAPAPAADAAPTAAQAAAQTAAQAAAQAAGPPPPPATADTANLRKAWSKADIAALARMAEDRAYLQEAIPTHPPTGELDWELISRFFGRWSKGGVAVRHQYASVRRLVREAKHEGRRGASYADLVTKALLRLPGRQGTVFEIQKILKQHYAGSLDKYRSGGRHGTQWKKAVGEVLREQTDSFQQAGKTDSGKILWRLTATAAGAQQQQQQ